MASIYANSMEQKKVFAQDKSSTPRGLVSNTNMAAISLFWNTNMAAMTSCENKILHVNPDLTYLNSDVGTSANSSFALNKPKLLTISVARTNWFTAVVTLSCKKGIERAMTFK